MPKFAPDNFKPSDKNRDWAITEFRITPEEVKRQSEIMIDHEFRRSYTDWQRVFKNWIRKADEIGSLKREHVYRQPEVITDQQKAQEIEKFAENIARLKSVK